MLIDGLLVWEKGSIRLYDCSDGQTPEQHYCDQDDFITVLDVAAVRVHVALLSGTLSVSPMTRPIMRVLARILRSEGFRFAICERAPGHVLPYATLIDDGILEGMWLLDVDLVLTPEPLA